MTCLIFAHVSGMDYLSKWAYRALVDHERSRQEAESEEDECTEAGVENERDSESVLHGDEEETYCNSQGQQYVLGSYRAQHSSQLYHSMDTDEESCDGLDDYGRRLHSNRLPRRRENHGGCRRIRPTTLQPSHARTQRL
jgi:hypothetical protein